MMYSPRSFPYLQHSPPSRSTRPKRMGTRSANSSPSPRPVRPVQPPTVSQPLPRSHSEPQSIPAANNTMLAQSKPVVIPSRSPSRPTISSQKAKPRSQARNGGPSRTGTRHDPNAIPPAVAALLAVTAIPKMAPRRIPKSSKMERTMSMDELIQEWKQDDSECPSPIVGSPLDLLLGRLDESEDECGSLRSLDQDKGSLIMSRSISSDSIATIPPSLDFEEPSYFSQWDNPQTPDSFRQTSLTERREKTISSPPTEDCVSDHPLLDSEPKEEPDEIKSSDIARIASLLPPSTERFKSFKSNLTASLQAIKSAAKSFSNFTAPSIPPDDFLTRALLSPIFTSEMRPKHLEGLPSPELRRYLNPQPAPISATELSMHLHDSLSLDVDDDPYAPMIQMQTYERRGRNQKTRRARNPDLFSEAGRTLSNEPTVRQREPRENADFLRVIVLEMNMRRVGKLDARAVGRARIWLPPRKTSAGKVPSSNSSGTVPERWVGIVSE